MLFNSFEFAIFFPIVTFLFFMLPHRFRWLLLLSASCFFYMFFKPEYILILFFTIIIDYIAGIYIGKTQEKRKRRVFLIISIIANLGVLAFFKYFNFLTFNFNQIFIAIGTDWNIKLLEIVLPIGLSFHTFQAMSYTIEVYRGKQQPEKHFGIYALYVMFYPQLVAGPIERPQNLLFQFRTRFSFDYERVVNGFRQILWGLFKKMVVADNLSFYSDAVFNAPGMYSGNANILAMYFFAIQIYCDFSGYSDIALGTARVMGFKLMDNFRCPYLSKSISEFWARWHISLSTWFKDYLYIPIGGNRVSALRNSVNLMIVFLVSGIWHGANWTFVVWGGLHGIYLIVGKLISNIAQRFRKKVENGWFIQIKSLFQVLLTFHLAAIAFVFFRAKSISDGVFMLKKMITENSISSLGIMINDFSYFKFAICMFGIIFLFIAEKMIPDGRIDLFLSKQKKTYRWTLYLFLIFIIFAFGNFNNEQFIYFQF